MSVLMQRAPSLVRVLALGALIALGAASGLVAAMVGAPTATAQTNPGGSEFVSLAPDRLLDSRPDFDIGPFNTPWGNQQTRTVQVAGNAGVPATGVDAVALNITTFAATADISWLTVHPTGTPRPEAAALNFGKNTITSELTNDLIIAKLSPDGTIDIYNAAGNVHLIIDVAGYYTTTGGSEFVSLAPDRLLDSRPDFDIGPFNTPWGNQQTRTVQVAGNAGVPATGVDAVALNITTFAATADISWLTVHPTGTPRPEAAALNFGKNTITSELTNDLIIAKLSPDGTIDIYNAAGNVHLIIDVAGYYTTEPPAIQGAAIGGTVTNNVGAPIANIEVCIFGHGLGTQGGDGAKCQQTAADGTYTIDGLANYAYRVWFNATGSPYLSAYLGDTLVYDDATIVALAVDEQRLDVDIVLASGGSIAGLVEDFDTAVGLGDIEICAIHQTASRRQCVLSSSDGQYEIQGLIPGSHLVFATDTLARYRDDVFDAGSATPVEVVAEAVASDVDFRLSAGAAITGTVTSQATGQPLANIDVCRYGPNPAPCTTTDANGDYRLAGLIDGFSYRIYFFDRTLDHVLLFAGGTQNSSTAAQVLVESDGLTEGVDMALPLASRISGTITFPDDSPSPGALACVSQNVLGGRRCAQAGADGSYDLGGLLADLYIVEFIDSATAQHLRVFSGQVTLAPGETATIDGQFAVVGGAIEGTIQGPSGEPVGDAFVCAYVLSSGFSRCADSRPDGTYSLTGLPSNDYLVQVNPQGGLYEPEFYPGASDPLGATLVGVVAGSTTSPIDFDLMPAASISGTVTGSDGGPLANVSVCVEGGPFNPCTQTRTDGTYDLRGLDAGTFVVRFSGVGFAREFYNDTYVRANAEQIILASGESRQNVDAVLSVGGSISGEITLEIVSATSVPVACATLVAEAESFCAQVDGNNQYTLTALPPGQYTVEFIDPSQENINQFWENATAASATEITVSAGQAITGIDAFLATSARVSGTLTNSDGAPITNAFACAQPVVSGPPIRCDQTDALGAYAILGLNPGSYRLYFQGPGLFFEYYDDVSNLNDAQVIDLAIGQSIPDIDAQIDRTGSVSGQVTSDTGAALPGMLACLEEPGFGGPCRTTDAAGRYEFDNVFPGSYIVHFVPIGANLLAEYYPGVAEQNQATLLEVERNSVFTDISAMLQAGGSIAGTVTDESTGLAIADALVCATLNGNGPCSNTGADGSYVVTALAAGDYEVGFSAATFASEWWNDRPTRAEADLVSVAQGAAVTAIDAALGSGGIITGTVTSPTNEAIPDMTVCALPAFGGLVQCAQTDANGDYKIESLTTADHLVHTQGRVGFEGEYPRVYFGNTPNFGDATRVSVTVGQTTSGIDITQDRLGIVSGVVTDVGGQAVGAISVCTGNGTRCSTTSAQGEYSIMGIDPGMHRIQFTSAGQYVDYWYGGATNYSDAQDLEIQLNDVFDNIDATLMRGGEISGVVTDANSGEPIQGVTACAFAVAQSLNQCGSTQADGSYVIAGLVDADYRMSFYHFRYVRNTYDDALVSVTGAGSTTDIDVALVVGGTITGTLTDLSGAAATNVPVCANPVETGGSTCTSSDNTGAYTIESLDTGSYTVRFAGFSSPFATQYYGQSATAADSTPVEVLVGQNTPNIDAVMTTGPSISGVVTGEGAGPLADVQVCITRGVNEEPGGFTPFGSGTCTSTLADGSYFLDALVPGTNLVQFLLAAPYLDADYEDGNLLDLAPFDMLTDVDIELALGGSIAGVVTDASGNPLADVIVCPNAVTTGVSSNCETSQADGSYLLTQLAPDSYRVAFHPSQPYQFEYYNDAIFEVDAEIIVVAAGDAVVLADAALGTGNTISGTVTNLAGDLLAAIEICLSGPTPGCVQTAADGTYEATGLADGDYTVLFRSGVTPADYLEETYDDADPFVPTTISVTGNETATADAALTPAGFISGTVTDMDTNLVADVQVCAAIGVTNLDIVGNCATTGAEGEYTIGGLSAGDHVVRFEDLQDRYGTQYYDGATTADVADVVPVDTSVRTVGIDAIMFDGGSISGTVTDEAGTALEGIRVRAFVPNESSGGIATTNSLGQYSILGLDQHSYELEFVDVSGSNYITEYYNDAADRTDAEAIVLTVSEQRTGVDAQLALGGSISGTITDEAGFDSIIVCAYFNFEAAPAQCSPPLASGPYHLAGLQPGGYEVRYEGSSSSWFGGGFFRSSATIIAVVPGQDFPGIDGVIGPVSDPQDASLSGAVTNEAGAAIEGVQVCAHRSGFAQVCESTDVTGTYTIAGLRRGEYTLFFDPLDPNLSAEWYDDTLAANAMVIELDISQALANLDAQLATNDPG